MARRSARPAAAHEMTLTPLKERREQCGQVFWVAHHSHRTIAMLSGLWRLTLVVRQCIQPSCPRFHQPYRPEEEGRWALPHGEFGLEVIALIGQWRFGEHRSVPEMHQALQARGISLAQRSVTSLMQRYEELATDAASRIKSASRHACSSKDTSSWRWMDCSPMWATKCCGSCVTAFPKKSCWRVPCSAVRKET